MTANQACFPVNVMCQAFDVLRSMTIGRKRVERLMKAGGPVGVSRKRSASTTIRDQRVCPALDPVDRNFYAEAPNQLWVADIT